MRATDYMAEIAAMLGELSDRYGNDGCNDYEMRDTVPNRELVRKAQMAVDPDWHELNIRGGKILTSNWIVCDYLKRLCKDAT